MQTITAAVGTPLQAVTTLTYNFAGDITAMQLPNGTTMGFTYDNARRLTKITDSLGNSSNFTLNNAGNVTKEERKDPGNTLKFQYTQTFDEMARILKHIGAGAQEWDFAYDKNSNLTSFTDANNNQTTYAFDALQRLVGSTDPISGVTNASINQLDQTTKIEDPRTNDTDYTYNAFGDVTQLVSPDTGTATFVVNKAGDVTQMTDSRAVVTNYTYDALNRLLTVAYPSDSTLNVTLTYDDNPTPGNCGPSKGELCRVVDPSGTTDYKYNALGQLIEVKEVRGALTFTTAYEYDLAGLLKKITYPSGRQATYTRNTNGQVTGVSAPVNGSAVNIASSITYLPFGPVTSLTYGNSKTLSATFDQDYRMTARSVGGVFSESYTYDANGNILTKGSHTYDYDAMNRIVEEIFGMTTTAWAYDDIGNRLSETVNSTPTAYTYPVGSSKLSSVGGTSYTYDAMGNVTQKGTQSYVYNAAAQMGEAKLSGVTVGTYTYNAYNQRTKKVTSSATVHYVYGPGGVLIGEYNGSGVLIREYIHANGEPLAQIDKPGASESILYLHTDHLLTARYATNAAGSTVWSWDSGAFGKETPTGSATVNLRFPGQYFDSETGLHYNWHRYYDPATGRYITSDPIGLAGGLGTFGYAAQNPLSAYDPDGKAIWWVGAGITAILWGITIYNNWDGIQNALNSDTPFCDLANLLGPQMLLDLAIGYGSAWVVEAAAVRAITGLVAQAGARLAPKITRAIKEYIEDESGSFDWNRGRPKSANLPKVKEIKMEHILSGHKRGGTRLVPGNNKTLFPEWMSPKQIEKAIREAYKNGKRMETQGTQVRVRGISSDGTVIDIWIDTGTGIIEGAWPIP